MFKSKGDKTIRLANKADVWGAGVAVALTVFKFVNTYNEYKLSKSITEGKVIRGETA